MRPTPAILVVAAVLAACQASPAVSMAPTGGEPADATPAMPSAGASLEHPALTGDVTTYRGDAARTGVMPGPGPIGTPSVAWLHKAGGPFASSPVVADGAVYAVSGDGTVRALRLVTGEDLWQAELGARASASPLLAADMLIAGDESGAVHALDVVDGESAWTTETDGPITGAAGLDGERLIVATHAGSAYAIDAASGRILWQTDVGGAMTRSVAIGDGRAYLGIGGDIVAVSISDGSIVWRSTVATDGDIGTPTASAGMVYAATGLDAADESTHGVAAVDAATGALVWRYASPSAAQLYTPAVANGRALVIGHDRRVVSLDAVTGAEGWSITRSSDIEALPAIVGDTLYVVGNDGPVEAIEGTTGKPLWDVSIQGIPYAPVVVDGYLLVGTGTGYLYAIGGPA